ncbi:uncharacterized protein LOC130655805 isoform X2 [Hydractinia symbiolongicarpus]|uniref:uncharacterized protein LOC130655805 isoform X2 n=1 Tax=Hydractinia symbiolongicarpus TaxID=13093 RepID=UPI0025510F09|nr:uncharacterized protein LOC130655805 isoform X2 [Hydractinia symbiolongicarpus]
MMTIGYLFCRLFCGSWLHLRESKPYKLTWINVPGLCFIICMIGPYCFALNKMTNDIKKNEDVPDWDFAILQTVMPVLVMTNLIYPLPVREKKNKAAGTASVMIGFLNAFDISDVITDYKYIQHYNTATEVWFFVSIVISIILLAFPIGLDEEDEDDPRDGRILKSIVSLIFTDVSFCVLRSIVMHKENSLAMGLVFAYKNAISACISIYLISKECCCSSESSKSDSSC